MYLSFGGYQTLVHFCSQITSPLIDLLPNQIHLQSLFAQCFISSPSETQLASHTYQWKYQERRVNLIQSSDICDVNTLRNSLFQICYVPDILQNVWTVVIHDMTLVYMPVLFWVTLVMSKVSSIQSVDVLLSLEIEHFPKMSYFHSLINLFSCYLSTWKILRM